MQKDFLGLNNFVWWFGVVENRLDPLELGRCQVRCFGWHNEDVNQIPIDKLPWAHPIVPYGVRSVQPPAEGTMVFGFFADGEDGQYPIIMGTVPGIPNEIRQNNVGFTDPYTEADKASKTFPRKIKEASIVPDTTGVKIVEDVPKRNPANLNEPTTSRLSRPTRGQADDGSYDGIAPESIAGTTIDIQRKTRITKIQTAANDTWDEPYPSFNAQYPFNNVTETESGHALELDDTNNFERVQLSHRTGSTLEFLPEGHTKIKSQKGRYDVTMGDHRNYVNGSKYETIDSDFFLRVNGKIKIQCEGFEISSGSSVGISAGQGVSVSGAMFSASGLLSASMTAGVTASVSAGVSAKVSGGVRAQVESAGVAGIKGKMAAMIGENTQTIGITNQTYGIQDTNSCIPPIADKALSVPDPVFPELPPLNPSDFPMPNINLPEGG